MLVTVNDTRDHMISGARPNALLRDEGADVDFWTAAEREYDSFRAVHMFTSRANNLYDEYDREIDRIRQAGGKTIRNPLALDSFDEGDDRIPEKRIAKFYEEAKGLGYSPRSLDQINSDIAVKVRGIKEKAGEGHDTTGAIWGRLGASALGAVQDPINITATAVTLPFGGWGGAAVGTLRGAAMTIGKTALFEAGVNAAAESFIQPFVSQYHDDVGLPYGMGDAAMAIGGAAVGGAVLGGAFRAGGIAIGEAAFRRSLVTAEVHGDPTATVAADLLDPGTRGGELSPSTVLSRRESVIDDGVREVIASLDPPARSMPESVSRAFDPDNPPSAADLLRALDDLEASGYTPGTANYGGARFILEDMVHVAQTNPHPRNPVSDMLHERALVAAARLADEGDVLPLARALEAIRAHRRAALDDLAARVERGELRGNETETIWHGGVSPRQVDTIIRELGDRAPDYSFPPANMQRRISSQGIRHALQKHGTDKLPLKPAHIREIPDVLENGELVGVTVKRGRTGLTWRKEVNGDWLYAVEIVGKGDKPVLEFRTAYWNKAAKKKEESLTTSPPTRPQPSLDAPQSGPQAVNVRDARGGAISDNIAPSSALDNAPTRAAADIGNDAAPLNVRPPGEAVREMTSLDDAALHVDAARILDEQGDVRLWMTLEGADGQSFPMEISARDALRQADNDLRTAELLQACPIKGGN